MADPQSNRLYTYDYAPGLARYTSAPGEAHGWFVACVDACSYGRMGLHSALKHPPFMEGGKRVVGVSSLDEALQMTWPYALDNQIVRCLVVRLPSLTREALIALLQLSEVMPYAAERYHQVVVLSPFDVAGVQPLLTAMGMANVRIVDARLSLPALCSAVLATPEEWMAERGGMSHELTEHERSVLRQTLQFRSVPQQARTRQVSVKTVYSQRFSALMKLGAQDIRSLLTLLAPTKKE
ncbi:helix-turn-helix transcriptional regulator [Serratia sp. T13T92]|uniref:helix-turn-helix transcriptional regulator n=1 Tax=Serratia sp. T13T92 TaxID=3397496 RepID=UPI0039E10029